MIIGGIDVGTTGAKIALYDENANLVDTYYNEYNCLHQNGNHEIDFNDVKNGVIDLLKSAASKHKIDAIGVTSFGETFALLDENDNILAPSMLYTDPRGEDEIKNLASLFGEEKLTLMTGVKPHAMYSIAKIMWLKNNCKEFSRAKRVLLGEDFIVYTLTKNAQIDYSLAARTGAFDIENKCFIPKVFELAGIDISLMSKPVETGTLAGGLTDEMKKIIGIDYDIKIVNGCHDQIAAMLGSGVFSSNQAMDGTGTVECIPIILESVPKDLELYECGYSVVPYINGKYACYALSFTGGATLKWFRDNFAELEHKEASENNKNVYAMLDECVKDDPTGILIMPHFAGAATPYMDNSSKATIIGLTLENDKYDIYKALMEGTSYEMKLNFVKLKDFTSKINEIRASGGGASSNVWLQIKADVLNTPITAISAKEIGAAGTCAVAGIEIGVYNDLKETVNKMVKVRQVFYPNSEKAEKYDALYQKYRNIYNAVKGL